MKYTVFINKERQEEVIIYVKEENELLGKIKRLLDEPTRDIIGYRDNEIITLDINEVYCFTVDDSRVYAMLRDKKYRIKERIYQLEAILPDCFIKINQSTIANVKAIKRFDASLLGSLIVEFKNGYRDSVSRRQMKAVKEKYGIK